MKLRILIIDDEECIRESLAMYLEDSGHEVTVASSPESCPVAGGCDCSQERPCADVLMVDQNMPGLKGSDFIRLQNERGCKAAFTNKVIMSGRVTQELLEMGRELGCLVLQKPFHFNVIDEFLAEVAGRLAAGANDSSAVPAC